MCYFCLGIVNHVADSGYRVPNGGEDAARDKVKELYDVLLNLFLSVSLYPRHGVPNDKYTRRHFSLPSCLFVLIFFYLVHTIFRPKLLVH